MSSRAKRAALIITVFLAFVAYRVVSDVIVTGSGGLGTVSARVSEAILDFLLLSALLLSWAGNRSIAQKMALATVVLVVIFVLLRALPVIWIHPGG
jgi:hypothetical protein